MGVRSWSQPCYNDVGDGKASHWKLKVIWLRIYTVNNKETLSQKGRSRGLTLKRIWSPHMLWKSTHTAWPCWSLHAVVEWFNEVCGVWPCSENSWKTWMWHAPCLLLGTSPLQGSFIPGLCDFSWVSFLELSSRGRTDFSEKNVTANVSCFAGYTVSVTSWIASKQMQPQTLQKPPRVTVSQQKNTVDTASGTSGSIYAHKMLFWCVCIHMFMWVRVHMRAGYTCTVCTRTCGSQRTTSGLCHLLCFLFCWFFCVILRQGLSLACIRWLTGQEVPEIPCLCLL